MQQFAPRSVAVFIAASSMMALLMQACGGGGDAHAQAINAPDPIEGLWQSNIALRDCASGAAIGGFRGLTTFNQGGTASADNNQPSLTKGVDLGTWHKTGTGAYSVDLRFWRYAADGTPAGQQRLTRTITLAADGKSLTSTITTQALDATDNVAQSACGAETGVRIGA